MHHSYNTQYNKSVRLSHHRRSHHQHQRTINSMTDFCSNHFKITIVIRTTVTTPLRTKQSINHISNNRALSFNIVKTKPKTTSR